jgi:WD40 repeat protein
MSILLLAALLSSLVIPTTVVHFSSGQNVTVSGPGSDAERLKYGETSAWVNTSTVISPRKDVAAVQFCTDHAMESGCVVYLVRPTGRIQELENNNVNTLFWTADGRYLIGADRNTVRLWNLLGGSRSVTPPPQPGMRSSLFEVTRIWLDRRGLCVASVFQTGPNQPRSMDATPLPLSTTAATTRYALPLLTALTTTVSPPLAAYRVPEAACRIPDGSS